MMRNPDPLLAGIALQQSDSAALVAFFKSRNEDYDYRLDLFSHGTTVVRVIFL
jgi:hypothetical protein